ncbi:DgyrCDS9755 [Dimorphilus gyrociliatus]|uniref:DgyrCDS9755 n=1 Tax=Dimorphilus gyrociliatus TaxID=2664684 RepID=A0A7I8W034_9ANNE|nr:DgyrCDS9755 [Dimorphilus gyrociliatus]
MTDSQVLFKSNTPRPPVPGGESAPRCSKPDFLDIEGASVSPAFHEQPSSVRWAENLQNLLEDREGVKLFKKFLDLNEDAGQLDFIFACRGLKMVSAKDNKKIRHIVKTIYRHYISRNKVELPLPIKKEICDRIRKRNDNLNQQIFNEAENFVEKNLKEGAYRAFIRSDLYVQHVAQANSDSSSASSVPPRLLPPLPEGKELDTIHAAVDVLSMSMKNTSAYSRTSVTAHRKSDGVHVEDENEKKSNPYYCAYVPVSAQDSELQSLSSDALTDDTLSLTDSSLDCVRVAGDGGESRRRHFRRNQRFMQQYASLNKTAVGYLDIPRLRGPGKGNLAESNPAEFHKQLVERLNEYLRSSQGCKESERIVKAKLRNTEDSTKMNYSSDMSLMDSTNADDPQNILDEHVVRVFSGNAWQEKRKKELHEASLPTSFMHSLSFSAFHASHSSDSSEKHQKVHNVSKTKKPAADSDVSNLDNGQKVLQWMMDKDNVGHKSGENSDPSSQRKSHKSNSSTVIASQRSNTSTLNQHNSKKRPVSQQNFTVVGYFFADEEIPYKFTMPGQNITLAQIKHHIKKGPNCRFFVKKESSEFDVGIVNEEITDDNEPLPLFEGKIILTISKLD